MTVCSRFMCFLSLNKNKLRPFMERKSRFNVRHLCFCIIYAFHGDIEYTNKKIKGLIHDLRFRIIQDVTFCTFA